MPIYPILAVALLALAIEARANCLVTGRVTDPAGAPIPGASVALFTQGQSSIASGRTGTGGEFTLGPLPCGGYVLAVQQAPFQQARRILRLSPSESPHQLIALSLVPVEEQVTVTAEAGSVEARNDAPQRITVVPRSGIAESAHTVLTEAARGQAGVNEQRTAPAMGSFFIRGLTGKNVSVYRDGFRYTTSIQRGGVSTFQNLVDPAALESVEFVRGPNSAQYGSDSLGGTVNLLSNVPAATRRRPSGELAPMADWASAAAGGHALVTSAFGSLQVVTMLAARRVNAVRPARGLDSHAAVTRFLGLPSTILDGPRLTGTGFTQYGGSFHAQHRTGVNQALILHYERGQQDGAKRYDQLLGGDGNLIAGLRNLMMDFGYARFQRFALGALEQVSVGASYHADREERVNQGGQGDPLAAISHQYERLASLGLTFLVEDRWRAHHWVIGGEGYRERVKAPAFSVRPATGVSLLQRGRVPDGARYLSHGVYLQDVWRPVSRLRVSGSVRFGGASYQSHRATPTDSLAANAFTGRIGASIRAAQPLRFHVQYGRGFRVPNVTDLGTLGLQGNGVFEANPNDIAGRGAVIGDRAGERAQSTGRGVERLRPESGDDVDAGATLESRRVRAEFTAFRMTLGNTIASQTLLLPLGAVGQPLGDQIISRQLPTGAVFVPLSAGPVLVRGNLTGAAMKGVEQSLRVALTPALTFNQNLTWIKAWDRVTGLPPDIEPGVPPLTVNPSLLYTRKRFWTEVYAIAAGRASRLSSLALSDRRIGATRSRASIASFFRNGARARGLVADGRLIPTGETLAQVQTRVLGAEESAPLFRALPGYGLAGFRFGVPVGERADIFLDVSNLADKSHRGIGWGIAGTGRSAVVKYRMRF